MVVYEKECRRCGTNGLAKYLTRMDETGRQRSYGHLVLAEKSMSSVEQENMKGLSPRRGEARLEMSLNLRRASNWPALLEGVLADPLAEFERRNQTRGLGDTEPRNGSKSRDRRRTEFDDSTETLEDRPGQLLGIPGAIPGS
jgi:hypothetical protein